MKKEYIIIAILIMGIAVSGIYHTVDNIKRERCYNMPINQYVEDKTCEKYTWEEYMEEHYGGK